MRVCKPLVFALVAVLLMQFSFAQQQEILKILNKELTQELKRQFTSDRFDGDTLVIVQPYRIKGNVLSMELKKKDSYEDTYYIHRQEVALDKITGIVKDINVIFETEEDAIKITDSTLNAKPGTPAVKRHNYNLFFIGLSYEKNNEALADKLVAAFKKAGYTIEKRFWAD